jgi:hypothetical protein
MTASASARLLPGVGGDHVLFGHRLHGEDLAAVAAEDAVDVGQVVLALLVVVLQLRQRQQQVFDAAAVVAGEDFLDLSLLGGAIDLLDDVHEVTSVIADDAAVAEGVVEHRRRHAGGGFLFAVGAEQGGQHFAAKQGDVAGEEKDIAAVHLLDSGIAIFAA